MMLDKASQKINITGFDLGEEATKEANNRKFVIKKLIINSERDEYYKMGYDAFNDDYLAFAPKETLQGKEAEYQTMFNDFFEEIPNDKEKHSLSECIKSIIFKGLIPQFETKCFRPKPAVTDKCRFVQGDILKLNEIVPPHNADVLLFRNALYHLTTKEGGSGFKISLPQEYVNMVVKKVVEQVDNSLNKNGLFVIGQHQSDHTSPVKDILYKELTKRNFIPAFTNQYDSIVTVWEKN